jgi:hypothetical protein
MNLSLVWMKFRRGIGKAAILGPISMIVLAVYGVVGSSDRTPGPLSISIVVLQILVAVALWLPADRINSFDLRVVVVLDGVLVTPSGPLINFALSCNCPPPYEGTCRILASWGWAFLLTLPLGALIVLSGIAGIFPIRRRPSEGRSPDSSPP